MATVTARGSTFTTTAGDKTVVATPAVGDLIVVIAASTGVATTAVTDTQSGTYVSVGGSFTGFSTTGTLNAWVRTALIPAATSTTWTATQTSSTGGGLTVLSVAGVTAVGAAAIRSSGGQSTGVAAATPAPVLSKTPFSTNPIITAVANASGTTTTAVQRTGYTEDFDNGYATPSTGLEVSHLASGETSATITYGGTSATAFASIALEIAQLPSVTQASFRFYEDGTESGSTATAAQDTNITRTVTSDSAIGLRVRLQNTTANPGETTDDYQLQVSRNSGTYTDINTTGITPTTAYIKKATAGGSGTVPTATFASAPTAGNVLIAIVATGAAQATLTATGWTIINDTYNAGTGSGDVAQQVAFYKVSDGSETTVALNQTSASTWTFNVLEYSGINTSNPVQVSNAASTVAGTTHTTPTVTTAAGQKSVVIIAHALSNAATWSNQQINASATGVTERADVSQGSSPIANSSQVSDLIVSSSASSYNGVATSSVSDRGVALIMVLNTAVVSGSVTALNSANLTDGGATTNRLGAGTGSFVAGKVSETASVLDHQLTASNYTEHLYSLNVVSSGVSDADTLAFRVLRNATALNAYTVTPTITVSKTAGGGAVATYSLMLLGVGA